MSELGEVTKLIAQLRDAENEATAMEEKASVAKERVRKLKEELIPTAMDELGYKEVKLDDGSKVSIKDEIYGSIPEAKRDAALAWLESNKFEGIIKAQTVIEFDKGDVQKMAEIVSFLNDKKLNHSSKRTVHPMTLKALAREQLEMGKDIPLDLLGLREVRIAKVSEPSASKFRLDE